jgi:hypothetical protein
VDVLINVAEMWVLITRAGAIAMALLVVIGLWRAVQELAEGDPPPWLKVYGERAAVRSVLLSVLLSVGLLLLWPPAMFVLGGGMAELSLRAQRSRVGAKPVALPAEGELTLTVWRMFGWTSIGLLPVSLPAWATVDLPALNTLVGFATALGAWAVVRGGPTPYPHMAELAWRALGPTEEDAPAVAAPLRKAPKPAWSDEVVREAARPVSPVEEDDPHAAARAAAQQLAGAAIAAQLRSIQRADAARAEVEARAQALEEAKAAREAAKAEAEAKAAREAAVAAEAGEVTPSPEEAAGVGPDMAADEVTPEEAAGEVRDVATEQVVQEPAADGPSSAGEPLDAQVDAGGPPDAGDPPGVAPAEELPEIAASDPPLDAAPAVPAAVVVVEPTVTVDVAGLVGALAAEAVPDPLAAPAPPAPLSAAAPPRPPAPRSLPEALDPTDLPARRGEDEEDDRTIDTSWT